MKMAKQGAVKGVRGFRQELMKSNISSVAKGTSLSRDMSHLMFWITLLVLAVANLIMVTVLVPLMLLLGQFRLVGFVALGLFNGYLFYVLISRIANLERSHHLAAAIIIPGLSVINLFIIMNGVGRLSHIFGTTTSESQLVISVTYIASFLAPYFAANLFRLRGASAYP